MRGPAEPIRRYAGALAHFTNLSQIPKLSASLTQGDQTMTGLLKFPGTIVVVLLTASPARHRPSYRNSYLVKPADFSHFAQLMHDVGAYWLGWNRCVWP